MVESLTISELATKIGAELGVSDWLVLNRDRINRFAEITEDTHEVHLNPVIARRWGFEDCFAHGFLTMSMLMRLQETALAPPSISTESSTTDLIACAFSRQYLSTDVSAADSHF